MTAPLTSRTAVLLVARREFSTQVRSRSFLIGLVITLAFFAGGYALFSYIGDRVSSAEIGMTAQTTSLRPTLAEIARAQDVNLTTREVDDTEGRRLVEAGEIDALLTGGPANYQLIGRDGVDSKVQSAVTAAAQQQTLTDALVTAGIDPAELAARGQVAVTTLEPVDPNRGEQLALAIVGTVLLFVSITGYGQLVATGVVEEKSSRVVELLLATIKPWQLLAGKVLGLGAVGLLQLVILGLIAALGATATGMLSVPGAAVSMFAMVIVWYLIGFFLFAALYAAIGSTVSRQEELNSLVAPMVFILVVPFVLTLNLLPNDPRNELATVLSFVPFFSQTVMPARYALGVAPLWQVVVAAVLALATLGVVVRLAGRVYRNSVLRTGARVSLREALATRA